MPKKYIGHVNVEHLLSEHSGEGYWALKWTELLGRLSCGDLFVVREYGSETHHCHYHYYLETGVSKSTVLGRLK